MGKFTDVDATNIFCKNLYVYEDEYANKIATEKWVAEEINDAINLLVGMINSSQTTGNKAYGAAKNHTHKLNATDDGGGVIKISLGGTKLPSNLATAAAGAGIAISSATKFTGKFGISSSSTALQKFVATTGKDFTWEVTGLGTILLAKSLYLVGEITDADETQWIAVSSMVLPILTSSLRGAVYVEVAKIGLNYTDPANTKHTYSHSADTISSPIDYLGGLGYTFAEIADHA
jgi:hypothetical protein